MLNTKYKIILLLITVFALLMRIIMIDKVPPSLFGDELDVGYQAYSILKTGKDYMGNPWPLHFKSIAEYRTPLYLYSAVPTVALFGITPLGVRLPSILFGTLLVPVYFFFVYELTKNKRVSLLASLLLTITPWHLQYSRAGFEVSEMLFFLIYGLYAFLKGLKKCRWFYVSAFFLAFTPWIYNTAKLYLPLSLVVMVFIYWRDLIKIPKKYLIISFTIFSIIITPFIVSTLYGGGNERFVGISIFNNPEMEGIIGFSRLTDNQITQNYLPDFMQSVAVSRVFHNKYIFALDAFAKNYIQAFSTSFLFLRGDPNPRQNLIGHGELYLFLAPFLLLGLYIFYKSTLNKKHKLLVFALFILSPVPSALTQGGGEHATRLILMLPFLLFLITLAIYESYTVLKMCFRNIYLAVIGLLVILSFVIYLHQYYFHYPWESEKLWHAGYRQTVEEAYRFGSQYNQVVVSSADEPSLLYFVSWSMLNPALFQKVINSPKTDFADFGPSYVIDKFIFTDVGVGYKLYDLDKHLPKGVLYISSYKEIGINLLEDPKRVPKTLNLVNTITYPSGQPAFYFFERTDEPII